MTTTASEQVIDGNCSLREAINAANNDGGGGVIDACDPGTDPGPDVIEFDIPGPGPHTIAVTGTGFTAITEAVDIDATSQDGYAGTPLVALDGSALTLGEDGLSIGNGGGGSTIQGLAIHSFPFNGINVSGDADNVTIQSNFIGTDVTGAVDLGNGGNGVGVSTDGNQIGGTSAGSGNLISANQNTGLQLAAGTVDNVVEGNLIGTDVTGTMDLGNVGPGIMASGVATIGGTGAGAGNLISGNANDGISLLGVGSEVTGNLVGTDEGGIGDLGNDGFGIFLNSDGNRIGGTDADAGNTIAFNDLDGIGTLFGEDNSFLGNEIHRNSGLAVDLDNDGVSENDPGDADPGSNNVQNFPVITDVTTGPSTTVDGELDTDGLNTWYRLEFFVQDAGDPSGFGEAESFLGFGEVETDGSGDAGFSIPGLGETTPGEVVTATATRLTGSGGDPLSTSELSALFHLCTITGTAGDDMLGGTIGNDVICGLDGDDTVARSEGDDIIIGGDGDDEIRYTAWAEPVHIDLAAGTATAGTKDDVLIGIEDARGSGNDDTLAGVAGQENELNGAGGDGDTVDYSGAPAGVEVDLAGGTTDDDGDGGTDVLSNIENVTGSAFQDTLAGAPGVANTLDGAGIGNTVTYADAGDGVIVDLVAGEASEDGGGQIDTLIDIRHVVGSPFPDLLTGDEFGNTLEGGDGIDTLIPGGGDDVVNGVGPVGDILDMSGSPGPITANMVTSFVDGDGHDFVTGVEVITGTPFGDTFIDSSANTFTFEGAAGIDRVDYSSAPGGVTIDLAAQQTTDDGDGGHDNLDSIEDATGSDHADTIGGDGGPNMLDGGDGADDLDGMEGDDTLIGGAGDDSLDGGSGNDVVEGGEGEDELDGLDGDDILRGQGDSDDLSGGDGNDTLEGGDGDDVLNGDAGVDTVRGQGGNDTASGGEGNDTVEGGEGNDDLDGDGSDDTVRGDAGNDTVNGGSGNDGVEGGDGDDSLFGESGDDTLNGGNGNDTLSGGDGNDTADGGEGNDSVLGEAGNDTMLGQGGKDTLTGGDGNDTGKGGGGNDTIIGQAGKDTLKGGGGKDTLKGGGGKDTLKGGGGKDTLKGGGGKDTCKGGGGKDKESSCEK